MQREEQIERIEREERERVERPTEPEVAEHPAPGVKHAPEPDAENIMPAEHEPGTL